jgi:large subunit ribosomal protein L22
LATTETREVRAQAKWVRTSPRKARLVAEHIRGRSVPEARAVLAFTPRAAAREMEKVLRSAVANAEANHGLYGEDLVVSAAYVDEGPTLKRWRARARGRVARIRKRTCHITVVVELPEPRPGAETPKSRRPSVRRPKADKPEPKADKPEPKADKPEPKAEAAPEATAATEPEAPAAAEEKLKPKRRSPVRRKKTEETEN